MNTKDFIQAIEKSRKSRVISYITSDRPFPLNARVAIDVIPFLNEQLNKIGKVDKIDLFLYSLGGDTNTPWRFVSMIREHCNKFTVIIPYKAHSAATMISLGADEIIMSDFSEISPIDPSVANLFNPSDPSNPQQKISISVEDVTSYFELANKKFQIKDSEDLAKIFMKFIEANPQIHPLALGNVHRSHSLIRMIAKKLLRSHKNKLKDEEIEKIIKSFSEELYSHHYFIGRKEAKNDLGLKSVKYADEKFSKLMKDLYNEYKKEMGLGKNWDPKSELGTSQTLNKDFKTALIETTDIQNSFNVNIDILKVQQSVTQQTPQGLVQIPQEKIDWKWNSGEWK